MYTYLVVRANIDKKYWRGLTSAGQDIKLKNNDQDLFCFSDLDFTHLMS